MRDGLNLFPDRSNPLRPVVILLAGFFCAMLIAFPVGMIILGLGTAGTVGVTLLIVVVAALCLGITIAFARVYERDRGDLLAGDAWARWELDPEEYERFVAGERRRMWRRAAAYALGGVALGAIFSIVQDRLTGGIMLGAFLLATFVILAAGGPPRGTRADARTVWIGSQGVHVLGRYLPLNATGTHATSVELEPGDPAALRFDVRTGRRTEQIRVPIPGNCVDEAEALIERFHRELGRRG